MQNKLAKILFSTRLTAILFIVFAAAMATGTILDRNMDTSPTPFTRYWIYNALWFEAIMAFFVINFIGNIFRFRLFRKEKWATLSLHLAFILILLGAFVTRYIGYEGMMPVREGATENVFLSQKTYITAYVDGDYKIDGVVQRLIKESEVDFSPRLSNDFKIETNYNQQPFSIELVNYIQGAEKDIIPDDIGEEYLKIVEAGNGKPHSHFLKVGQVQSIHNVLISLNNEVEGAINITYKNDELTIKSPFEGEYMTMATRTKGQLMKDSIQPLMLRSRYLIGNMQMVFPKPVVKGTFGIVKKSRILRGDEDGITLKVTSKNETKHINLLGGKFINNPFEKVTVGGLDFNFKFGSKVMELPFQIKLNDFIAERYPGTENSYSSYESKVTVVDKQSGDYDYRIYMNNILDHKGYRFFQASFNPDEKGTVLSVNHDFWGTWITYIGYFLLFFGLLSILFSKHTHFDHLKEQLKSIKEKKSKLLTIVLVCVGLQAFSQTHNPNDGHEHNNRPTKTQIDSILQANITPKAHADKYGHMVIQDYSGRMMPVNTFASEILRKLSKKDAYENYDANQILLSMQESPLLWYNVPIIYLELKKGDSIRKIIGVDKSQKYITLVDFFTKNGAYKLAPYLDEAYKAQTPNGFQNKFKMINERVNLLYSVIDGRALKVFPVPDDENHKWISSVEFREENYRSKIEDSLYGNFINNGISAYLLTLNEAKKTRDFSKAEELLAGIKRIQKKYGSAVMLSDEKIKTEIQYNKYDIFKNLHYGYMLVGALLFVILIVQIFNGQNKIINVSVTTLKIIIIFFFLLHTLGLIVRWYLSGHAPWSDAYESMIYVAWATLFFGLIFGRKSDLTIASTAFVASMILMIAHWNWMDPTIANLEPVLDSYWLMIHVAIIVASYGPFTLGMILGVISLLLMTFTTKSNKDKMLLNIQELTVINEMSLTVGLVMLAIGTFLGGIWANESWGRYWGWDPKETWALISIMIYAFVIHMRLIPGLRSRWGFNLASIIAFASILMTYFGVNFYLSGLHSYASGDQIISFEFIGIAIVLVTLLGFFAYRGYDKFYRKS